MYIVIINLFRICAQNFISSYNKVVVILVPLQGLYAILLIDTVD